MKRAKIALAAAAMLYVAGATGANAAGAPLRIGMLAYWKSRWRWRHARESCCLMNQRRACQRGAAENSST